MSMITANRIILSCPAGFSLGGTLLSGQCFRWQADGDGFFGCAADRAVRLTQQDETITITGDDRHDAERFWREYLDLDTDYCAIREHVTSAEPRLAAAVERCGGVYILRQQPWEALCSFIISQNNNIPRIRSIIDKLCRSYGRLIPDSDGQYAFPTPEAIAAAEPDELRLLGCGYRADYLPSAAADVLSGRFDPQLLWEMPLEQAQKTLQAMRGVGPKVADCVLLYGLHRLDAFPRDVWIKRALDGEFKGTSLQTSPYAGVAQQYIFEYIRSNG